MLNDQNPSPIINEMAQQRSGSGYTKPDGSTGYTPTSGEQRMLGQFDQRQVELERIATAGGGVASLPDYAAKENDEKMKRWAGADTATPTTPTDNRQFIKTAIANRTDMLSRLAAQPSLAADQRQFGLNHRTRQRTELAFENGGKPETAEELLARISGKYNVANQPAPAPQPQTQAAPQPQQPKSQPGSLIQQAAGYAQGGKIKGLRRSFEYGGLNEPLTTTMSAGQLLEQNRAIEDSGIAAKMDKLKDLSGNLGSGLSARQKATALSSIQGEAAKMGQALDTGMGNGFGMSGLSARQKLAVETGALGASNSITDFGTKRALEEARANYIDQNKLTPGYGRGGKIKGPGTATSDSILAKTGTGEPIRVANGERIVSVEQDKALERIAEMLNYESVDAMFEALTGKPVGPTMKAGLPAAAGGLQPGQTVDDGTGGVYTPEAGFNPGQAVVNMLKDSATAARTGVHYDQVRQNRIEQGSAPTPYSNEGRAVPVPVTDASRHPISVPANRAAAAQPIDNTPPMPLVTRDVVPGGYQDRGAGILAQRGAAGRLNVTNVGTADITDPTKRIVDGSASALIDQKGSTYNPAAQLERMQRLRMQYDATDPTITDPAVRAKAIRGLEILNAGRQAEAQANAQNAQARLHSNQAISAGQMLGLHREYLDPNTTLERRTELHGIIRALSGKERDPVNLQVHDVEEPLDPKQPLLGNRKVPHVFDPRTGQSRPMLQVNDPMTQARAAIARGADPRAVNARLKAMGLQEVK